MRTDIQKKIHMNKESRENRTGTGLVHIYSGDGKGKTTAGMGLCVRAAGAGYRVLICHFMKDGSSSERRAMEHIPGITFVSARDRVSFSFRMSEEEKRAERDFCRRLLADTISTASAEHYDVLFLDEVLYAVRAGFLEESELISFLEHKPGNLEVILTGRDPGARLLELCDYHSEICKRKHPFDRQQGARDGIER